MDLGDVTEQILRNCHISDARHAGLYSICGLALRLRDLYKWEMGLPPWQEGEPSQLLEWIGKKEEVWDHQAEEDFTDIVISHHAYDLFDSAAINAVLEPHGLFYGAGYVYGMKPTFFLAPIEEVDLVAGHRVYILGKELARDLLTVPALSQNGSVVIRKESAKLFLWNQIMFLKKSARHALQFSLHRLGLKNQSSDMIRKHLDILFNTDMARYIHHELAEMEDRDFAPDIWREIVSAFSHTPIEILARAVKDLLADTNQQGPLIYLIRERNEPCLGLYVAFLDGMVKALFPEMGEAFLRFTREGDWNVIEDAVSKGHSRAKTRAVALCHIYGAGKQNNDLKGAAKEIEERLLAPLGVVLRKA